MTLEMSAHLKLLRIQRGWTKVEAAAQVGCTVRQWDRWENADSAPSYWQMKNLVAVFGRRALRPLFE